MFNFFKKKNTTKTNNYNFTFSINDVKIEFDVEELFLFFRVLGIFSVLLLGGIT